MTAGAQASRRSGDHLNSNILRPPLRNVSRTTAESDVWNAMRAEAEAALIEEPLYAGIIQATVLDQPSLIHAFAYRLAHRLGDGDLARLSTRDLCLSAFQADPYAGDHAVRDLVAIRERDPTCRRYLDPFLFYKGLAALEGYRVAHWLWHQGRVTLALHIQSRISEVFGADIHPAARIGSGVFIDHATGVVIGETTVIADDVSILQSVTLGATARRAATGTPRSNAGFCSASEPRCWATSASAKARRSPPPLWCCTTFPPTPLWRACRPASSHGSSRPKIPHKAWISSSATGSSETIFQLLVFVEPLGVD